MIFDYGYVCLLRNPQSTIFWCQNYMNILPVCQSFYVLAPNAQPQNVLNRLSHHSLMSS